MTDHATLETETVGPLTALHSEHLRVLRHFCVERETAGFSVRARVLTLYASLPLHGCSKVAALADGMEQVDMSGGSDARANQPCFHECLCTMTCGNILQTGDDMPGLCLSDLLPACTQYHLQRHCRPWLKHAAPYPLPLHLPLAPPFPLQPTRPRRC